MTPTPVDALLQDLELANLIRLDLGSESMGTFRHVLVQDSAYESLLRPERRDLHREVGETLERLARGRADDVADVLAHHFDEGGEPTKALRLYVRAGELASRRSANQEAAMLYGRALALAWLVGAEDEVLTDVGSRKGRALELAGRYNEALISYNELIEAGRRQKSWRVELAGLVACASIRAVPTEVFNVDEARKLTDRALALARAQGDRAAESRILWIQMGIMSFSDPVKGVSLGETSLQLSHSLGLREQTAFTLNDLGYAYLRSGRLDKARQTLEEARQAWTELDNPPMLADNLVSTATLLVLVGDIPGAFRLAREGLELAERIDNLWGQAYARMPMAQAYFLQGEVGACIACLRECLRLAEPAGFLDPQITMRSLYGVCLGLAGDVEGGLQEADRAYALAGSVNKRWLGTAVAARALLHAAAGDLAAAEAQLEELATVLGPSGLLLEETSFLAGFSAAEVALLKGDADGLLKLLEDYEGFLSHYGTKVFRPLLTTYRGLAYLKKDDLENAAHELEESVRRMDALGLDLAKWRAYASLADVRQRQHRLDEARQCHREAADRLARIASSLPDPRLQELFRSQKNVRAALTAVV